MEVLDFQGLFLFVYDLVRDAGVFVIDIVYCNFKVIGIIQEQKPMLLYII